MAEFLLDAEEVAFAALAGIAATAVAIIIYWVCSSVHLEFNQARSVTFGDLLYAIGEGVRVGIMLIFFALAGFASFVYLRIVGPVLEIEIYRRT